MLSPMPLELRAGEAEQAAAENAVCALERGAVERNHLVRPRPQRLAVARLSRFSEPEDEIRNEVWPVARKRGAHGQKGGTDCGGAQELEIGDAAAAGLRGAGEKGVSGVAAVMTQRWDCRGAFTAPPPASWLARASRTSFDARSHLSRVAERSVLGTTRPLVLLVLSSSTAPLTPSKSFERITLSSEAPALAQWVNAGGKGVQVPRLKPRRAASNNVQRKFAVSSVETAEDAASATVDVLMMSEGIHLHVRRMLDLFDEGGDEQTKRISL